MINMKNTSFIILFLIYATFSCSKNSSGNETVDDSKSALYGKWEWIESKGGISGNNLITPNSSNKTVYLEITNNKIMRFENGVVTATISYTIESKRSIFTGVLAQMIVYNQDSQVQQSFEISNNNLKLNDECPDCFKHFYIRK